MPDKCYKNAQEFAEELVKILGFPLDTASVIKGAKGDTGNIGPKGDAGQKGDPGPGTSNILDRIEIDPDATYIDIEWFVNWEKAIYKIKVTGTVGDTGDFDPLVSGVVGIGTIAEVFVDPLDPVKRVRVYFLFSAGITGVPGEGHVLLINTIE